MEGHFLHNQIHYCFTCIAIKLKILSRAICHTGLRLSHEKKLENVGWFLRYSKISKFEILIYHENVLRFSDFFSMGSFSIVKDIKYMHDFIDKMMKKLVS